MDIVTVIKIVRAATAAMEAARALAIEAKAVMSEGDQVALARELERLGQENDAGHAAFQEKLGAASGGAAKRGSAKLNG